MQAAPTIASKAFLMAGILIATASPVFSQPAGVTETPNKPILTKVQQQAVQRGYGMFLHFGINTFNQTEWSDGKLPVTSYNPTQLDCDQWIATAKEAGFRHVVLVTKHHDGFCLWPTACTDYCVKSSPVKTDVVRAVADACKKHGVKLGLYYSLWDRHEPTHQEKSPESYVNYMKNQLRELLTNYGPVCEIWFDGGWGKPARDWDIPGLYALVKELQPDCAMTVNLTIGIGQKDGIGEPVNFQQGDRILYFPVDFRTKDPNLARWDDPKFYRYEDKLYYLPFEHTLCLSDRWNWFQKKDVMPTRSVDELEELFYWCTANNSVMLLNVPPDQSGRLRENERQRVLELADRLGIRGGENPLPAGPDNLAMLQKVTATSNAKDHDASKAVDVSPETAWLADADTASLEITFDKTACFNRIALWEYADMKDLGDSFSKQRVFRVKRFNIEVMDGSDWRIIHTGATIGAGLAIPFDKPVQARKLRINFLECSLPPGLLHVNVNDSHGTRHER